MQRYLKEHQRDFMPEDTKAGMIQAYLDKYTGETVCSKQLYKEALNHTFDEPKQWEIREINEIMNQCITGWNYFSNPRMFAEYGRQKGWEREIPATDTDNPPEKSMDGFVEVTEPVSYTHLDVYKRQRKYYDIQNSMGRGLSWRMGKLYNSTSCLLYTSTTANFIGNFREDEFVAYGTTVDIYQKPAIFQIGRAHV